MVWAQVGGVFDAVGAPGAVFGTIWAVRGVFDGVGLPGAGSCIAHAVRRLGRPLSRYASGRLARGALCPRACFHPC